MDNRWRHRYILVYGDWGRLSYSAIGGRRGAPGTLRRTVTLTCPLSFSVCDVTLLESALLPPSLSPLSLRLQIAEAFIRATRCIMSPSSRRGAPEPSPHPDSPSPVSQGAHAPLRPAASRFRPLSSRPSRPVPPCAGAGSGPGVGRSPGG